MGPSGKMARMRCEAQAEYRVKYTPERNYALLMEIYERVAGEKIGQKQEISQAGIVR